MPITDRDLASVELWQDSLERSRRRRTLAESARKDIARKKTASLAVSAAVAATPAWPGGIAAASGLTKERATKLARKLERRHIDRILLERGDWTPAVVELQRALKVADDGIFGPITEAAVLDWQQRHHVEATGQVDTKMWLELFPNDLIVYAPTGSAAKSLGGAGSSGPQWAAIDTSQLPQAAVEQAPKTVMASVVRRGDHAKAAKRSRSRAHRAAMTPVALRSGGDESPAGTDVAAPPAEADPAPQHTSVPESVPQPTPSFPGLGGGKTADIIRALIAAANDIDSKHYSYRWGGGHDSNFTGPYDCSGAVSAVLHAAGLLDRPMVSGDFTRWGASGAGMVTIYANSGHVYMSIKGRFFGTTRANPGGGAGWFDGAPRAGFTVMHVPFEKLSPKRRSTVAKATTRMTVSSSKQGTVKAAVPLYTKGGAAQAPAAKSQSTTVASAQSSGQASAGQESYAAPQQDSYASGGSSQEAAGTQAAAPQQDSYAAPQETVTPQATPAPAPAPAAPETVTPAPAPQATPAPAPAPETVPPAPAPAPAPAAPETVAPQPAPAAPAAPETATPQPAPAPAPSAPESPATETPAPEVTPAPATPEAEAPAEPEAAPATEASDTPAAAPTNQAAVTP